MVRFLVGGLEKGRHRTSDFVSYLLFEPGYLQRLIELGREDAEDQWPRIRDFLGWKEEDCRPPEGARDEESAVEAGAGGG